MIEPSEARVGCTQIPFVLTLDGKLSFLFALFNNSPDKKVDDDEQQTSFSTALTFLMKQLLKNVEDHGVKAVI